MKKTLKIILYFLVFIILLTNSANAEDVACKISLSANKTTLNAGDELIITLSMSNVSKENGISDFVSVLEFSDDIFELVFEEDEELSAALENTEFKDCKILYSGDKDTDTTIKNPWYLLCLEDEEGGKAIYGSTSADPQISNQVVGKIRLKVKGNAETTKATISITDTEVFDPEAISKYETTGNLIGYEIEDSKIELQIKGKSNNGGLPVNNSIQNNAIQKNNINIDVNTHVENKANQNVPYTGIEDYIIPFIFIVVIIAVLAYINYRKYKEI